MPRSKKGGAISRFKHKKIIKLSKHYRYRRKNVFRISKEAVLKSLYYSYRDRIKNKSKIRLIWISFINWFLKNYNINYNNFIYKFNKNHLILNRKILFDIIIFDKFLFFFILKKIKCFDIHKN